MRQQTRGDDRPTERTAFLSLSLSLFQRALVFGQFVLRQILNGLLRATEIDRALNNGSTGTQSESGTKPAVEIIPEDKRTRRETECGNGDVDLCSFLPEFNDVSDHILSRLRIADAIIWRPDEVGRGHPPLRPVEGKAAFVLRRETINYGKIVRSTILGKLRGLSFWAPLMAAAISRNPVLSLNPYTIDERVSNYLTHNS